MQLQHSAVQLLLQMWDLFLKVLIHMFHLLICQHLS